MTTVDPAAQAAILALIPGSVPLGTWDVTHAANSADACVYLDSRRALLPAGTHQADRLISLHEQGHVRWDMPLVQLEQHFPAIHMPYVDEFYRMLREWVVDMRLTAYVEDIRESANILDWSQMPDPSRMPMDAVARQFIQWYYRSQHPNVVDACRLYVRECWSLIDGTGLQLLTDAYAAIKADLLDDTASELWAVKLAAHFAPPPPPPQSLPKPPESAATQQQRAAAQQQQLQQQQLQQAAQRDAQDAQQQQQAAMQVDARLTARPETFDPADAVDDQGNDLSGQKPRQTGDGQGTDRSEGAGGADDHLTIPVHRHMDIRRPGKRIKDPIGMRQSGSVPTHTEYLRTGGAIFKESPKPTGTILIDVSSSMCWTEQQLRDAIRVAPNLTVAGYAANGNQRMLCIIAHNGRTSNSVPCMTGYFNDGSDLPALLWLSRQPEPRIVVSDGGFYGLSARRAQYKRVCDAIMKRGKVTRVESMPDAIAYLKGRLAPASKTGSAPVTPTRRRR